MKNKSSDMQPTKKKRFSEMKASFRKRLNLTVSLVLFVFCVMVATFIAAGAVVALLHRLGVISFSVRLARQAPVRPFMMFLVLFGLCILLGTALTAFLSKKTLNPISKIISATNRVAQGDFSVRVDIKGIGEMEELSESFNKMAEELSSIETLRSDFVNNFSHEFKTPIVSICGFAKLLKEGTLSEAERFEYLDIIMTESRRLAELSEKMLNLTKYEHMEIITEKAPFRIDEQIRLVIVLMEPKWSAKAITFNVNLEETVYNGNEDLIKQLWLNLIDNAVKFSYQGGLINVSLASEDRELRFSVQDEGPGMDEQTKAHIFDKFYQGESARLYGGNGLGLTLAKRIVGLCGGRIEAYSEQDRGSTLTVILPI